MIPSAISCWFAPINDDGSLGNYFDLGNCTDIALSLGETYADHMSSRQGIRAIDKSVISELTGDVKITLDELVGNNLKLMFKPQTAVDTSATDTVYEQKRIRLNGTTAVTIDKLAVESSRTDYLDLTIQCVQSNDGGTTYTAGDYTFTQAAGSGTARTPATIARSGTGSSISDGEEVVVKYTYSRNASEYIIQEGSVLEGALRIQCLNRIGPLFAFEFPFVSVTVEGDMTINPAEFLSRAFNFKVLTPGDGVRGRFYLYDQFQKLTSSDLVAC
jgi:hypothetical protein